MSEPTFIILDETTEAVVILDDRKGDNDELGHIFCPCDENRALCGTDVSDTPELAWDDAEDNVCVVCLDLEPLPCERCGAI